MATAFCFSFALRRLQTAGFGTPLGCLRQCGGGKRVRVYWRLLSSGGKAMHAELPIGGGSASFVTTAAEMPLART